MDLKSNSRAKYPCTFLMLSRLLGTAWEYLEKRQEEDDACATLSVTSSPETEGSHA